MPKPARCQYNDGTDEDDCTYQATHRVEYAGEQFRVCGPHAEATVPGWELVEPLADEQTAPEPEEPKADLKELKKLFGGFYDVRDAMKKGTLHRLKASEAAVLWQYLINTM